MSNKVPKFTCHLCNFNCNRKAHYEAHLNTKKHKNRLQNNVTQQNACTTYNMSNITQTIDKQTQIIDKLCHEVNSLKQQITNTTVQQTNIFTNSVNNTVNITINPYGKENWDYFKDQVCRIMMEVNMAIPNIVRRIHLDDNHPENHNIQIPNKKINQIKVFDGQNWTTQNKNAVLESLVSGTADKLTDYEEAFLEQSSPYLYELWRGRYNQLTNTDHLGHKKIMKETRDKLEYLILDYQRNKK